MASEQQKEEVADPTGRLKRDATLSAAERLEGLKCLHLMGEYRHCISGNHQFHQYYIHGEFSHCKIERARMYNCMKWKSSHNQKAKEALLRSFEEEQLSMHTPTPVWRMREHPPTEWNGPDTGGININSNPGGTDNEGSYSDHLKN